jgi:hypothetical protein
LAKRLEFLRIVCIINPKGLKNGKENRKFSIFSFCILSDEELAGIGAR